VREARARYRRSDEAREDHRDRMREWRERGGQRERAARVMDQPSAAPAAAGIVAPAKEADDVEDDQVLHLRAAQRCVECGRTSRFARWYPSRCSGRAPAGPLRR